MYQLILKESASVRVNKTGEFIELGSAASALLYLLGSAPDGMTRQYLVTDLYPGQLRSSGLSALRQLLFRVRSLLGENTILANGPTLTLNPTCWTIEKGQSIGTIPGFMPADAFRNLIVSMTEYDKIEARRMLVSQSTMSRALHLDSLLELLRVTKPSHAGEPFAGEHLNLVALTILGCGAPAQEARQRIAKSKSLALKAKRADLFKRASTLEMFLNAETGNYPSSAPEAPSSRKDLYSAMALSAWQYHDNQTENSVRTLMTFVDDIESQAPATQIHFWTNLSVVAVGKEHLELGMHALSKMKECPLLPLDKSSQRSAHIARARQLLVTKDYDAAQREAEKYVQISESMGWTQFDYPDFRVDLLLAQGEFAQAANQWKDLSRRFHANGRANNRRFQAKRLALQSIHSAFAIA